MRRGLVVLRERRGTGLSALCERRGAYARPAACSVALTALRAVRARRPPPQIDDAVEFLRRGQVLNPLAQADRTRRSERHNDVELDSSSDSLWGSGMRYSRRSLLAPNGKRWYRWCKAFNCRPSAQPNRGPSASSAGGQRRERIRSRRGQQGGRVGLPCRARDAANDLNQPMNSSTHYDKSEWCGD